MYTYVYTGGRKSSARGRPSRARVLERAAKRERKRQKILLAGLEPSARVSLQSCFVALVEREREIYSPWCIQLSLATTIALRKARAIHALLIASRDRGATATALFTLARAVP